MKPRNRPIARSDDGKNVAGSNKGGLGAGGRKDLGLAKLLKLQFWSIYGATSEVGRRRLGVTR